MSDINEIIETAQKWGAPQGEAVVPEDWYDEEDSDVRLGWRIENRGSADWAMKRLGECEVEVESIEGQKAAAIERIEHRAAMLIEKARRGMAFFTYALASWAARERVALCPGKKKSADLLHGRIGWRTKGGKLVVEDKAALVAWLERQPPEAGLFRLKVEPEMKALQDNFKSTGEIPPGCTYDPGSETFYVEPVLPEGNALKGKE